VSHETHRNPEKDGFRAAVSVDAGRVVLRSRRGTEMGPAFPEVVAGAVQLPDATAMDGELVVWDAAGRLAFERLQNRLSTPAAVCVLSCCLSLSWYGGHD
jgi:ATP-dependent DNA ligase